MPISALLLAAATVAAVATPAPATVADPLAPARKKAWGRLQLSCIIGATVAARQAPSKTTGWWVSCCWPTLAASRWSSMQPT